MPDRVCPMTTKRALGKVSQRSWYSIGSNGCRDFLRHSLSPNTLTYNAVDGKREGQQERQQAAGSHLERLSLRAEEEHCSRVERRQAIEEEAQRQPGNASRDTEDAQR